MIVKWKINGSFLESNSNNVIYNKALLLNINFLNKRFIVYNGHRFVSLLIKDFMLGHKVGEFIVTKRLGKKIHFKKK